MSVSITALDVQWTKRLIDLLNDGGVWIWPASGGLYKLDKQQRQFLELMRGDDEDGREVLRLVLERLDWTLVPAA